MPRPIKLSVLQSTPTWALEAGPDNRLCIKCGLWNDQSKAAIAQLVEQLPCKRLVEGSSPSGGSINILFLGSVDEQEKKFLLTICRKQGYDSSQVAFLSPVLCASDNVSPHHLRMCRAFILDTIRSYHARHVVVLGPEALASLRGKSDYKNIDKLLGREQTCEDLPGLTYVVTYHPSQQLTHNSIQKGKRLALDIKKLKWNKLTLPEEAESVVRPVVGVDTEFDSDKVWTISVGDDTKQATFDIEDNTFEKFSSINLATIVGHNLPCELDSLVRVGMVQERWLKGRDCLDSMILMNIYNENLPMKDHLGLEASLCRMYRAPNWKAETEVLDESDPGSWGVEKRRRRCGYDAWATYKLYEHPSVLKLIDKCQYVVYWQHRMLPTYHRLKYAGVMVDRSVFDKFHNETLPKEQLYYNRVVNQVKSDYDWNDFNPKKGEHLVRLLYKKMKLPVLKWTKNHNPATDADALENYSAEPEIQDLLEWRKANKLMSTWYGKEAKGNTIPLFHRIHWKGDGLGYLPVNLGVGITSTLRRQSNAPNMQNWNKKTRGIITSRFGSRGKLLWSDYEKLEVFLLADQIKSKKLLNYFLNKGGYLGIAEDLMGSKITKDHPNYRATKAVVLAANYFATPYTVANQLYYKAGVKFSDDWPTRMFKSDHYARCRELLDTYFCMFPEIYDYFMETKTELLKNQCVVSRLGQIRHLPCPKGEDTPGFKHLLNQAINFKIQSVAGHVTGIAAVLIEEQLVSQFYKSYTDYHGYLIQQHKDLTTNPKHGILSTWKEGGYLCNEVHDELVVDVSTQYQLDTQRMMKEMMVVSTKKELQKIDPLFDAHLGVEEDFGQFWHVKEGR